MGAEMSIIEVWKSGLMGLTFFVDTPRNAIMTLLLVSSVLAIA